jgi:hypothetical protein
MTAISLPGCFRKRFRKQRIHLLGMRVGVANPKVKITTDAYPMERTQNQKRPLGNAPLQYLFLLSCSVEKVMHQRPNPIHSFFQREMARVEKMEFCAGNISRRAMLNADLFAVVLQGIRVG